MFCTFASRIEIYLNMLYYIRKYPVSLLIILTVIYLSFFKPPQTEPTGKTILIKGSNGIRLSTVVDYL